MYTCGSFMLMYGRNQPKGIILQLKLNFLKNLAGPHISSGPGTYDKDRLEGCNLRAEESIRKAGHFLPASQHIPPPGLQIL